MSSAMRFGDFIWPNNPESLEITYRRDVEMEATGSNSWAVRNHGRLGRVFVGEGDFFGPNAYAVFGALAQKFKAGVVNVLSVPNVESVNALMTDLVLQEKDAEDYLHYRFTFVETN